MNSSDCLTDGRCTALLHATETVQFTRLRTTPCHLLCNPNVLVAVSKDIAGRKTLLHQNALVLLITVLFCSYGATMEAVAGMLLHSTALRPVSCTGPMRIPGVCV